MHTLRNIFLGGLLLLAAFIPSCAHAADTLVTLTVTVTNTPSDGNTLVVNGATRVWRTSPSIPGSEIELGTNVATTASALYNHASRYAFTGPVQTGLPATNQVTLRGQINQALVASLTGTWASLAYTTNNVTNAVAVRIPVAIESAGTRGRIADGLVEAIGTYALTNKFPAATPALDHFVDVSESQVISGDKTFLGATRFASPQTTNLVNRGNAISSPGSASGSEQFGTGATATGTNSLAVGNGATVGYRRGIAMGNSAASDAVNAIGIGYAAVAGTGGAGDDALAIGTSTSATAARSAAIGSGSAASGMDSLVLGTDATDDGHTNTVVLGTGATATDDNQVVLGSTTQTVVIPGRLDGVTVTNATLHGTAGSITGGTFASPTLTSPSLADATLTGTAVVNARTRLVHTTLATLANGANAAVNAGDYTFLRLTAGPTAAFSIAGFAGGATGRLLIVYNATGQDLTIDNEGGSESVSTNRIITCTGTNLTITGSGCATFLYDGSAARWILVSAESPDLSAGNFVDLASAQTVTGAKIFASITTTNLVNYGDAISSRGTGTNAEQFGDNAAATADNTLAVGDAASAAYAGGVAAGRSANAGADAAVAVGYSAAATGTDAVAIGESAAASATGSIAIGSDATSSDSGVAVGDGAAAGGSYGLALGYAASAGHARSVAIGNVAATWADDQIVLGGAGHTTQMEGHLVLGGGFSTGVRQITGLSSGTNNAVNISTGNRIMLIPSGPVGAFVISGLGYGVNGREVILVNQTGQNMTLLHDNAAESTAANRIVTMTGADLVSTGNGSAHLVWEGYSQRWIVVGWQP